MNRIPGLALAALLAAVPRAGAQEIGAATWVAPEGSCVGISAGWSVPAEVARAWVGPRHAPLLDPETGRASVSLFGARCRGSTIDGDESGTFTTAHTIVPIEPHPVETAPEARRWIAIPHSFGPEGAPVRRLFERHGFAALPGEPSVSIRPGPEGTDATLTIETAHGRIVVEATFPSDREEHPFETVVALAGTRGEAFVGGGPESSLRLGGGSFTVHAEGETILADLGSDAEPGEASLDRRFGWRFAFRPANPVGKGGAVLADPARPEEERAEDAGRRPLDVYAWWGIGPGSTVADVFPGEGYNTHLLSRVVGDEGKVYGVLGFYEGLTFSDEPTYDVRYRGRLEEDGLDDVEVVSGLEDVPTDALDAAVFVRNYHDVEWVFPELSRETTVAELKRVLRPGGVVGIVDVATHRPGWDEETHRLNEEVVIDDFTAAGFALEGRSQLLANPDDDHTSSGRDPGRHLADRYLLRFRSPE